VDEAVLRALRPVILRYCRARLSHHAADDVAQEVCLALISARHGRQDGRATGRTVTAYAFGIAQHKVADAMRASARLAVPVSELPDIADARPGPEETVLARWEGEQVRRALAQLPPPQRRLLQLRVVSGFTAAETCATGSISGQARAPATTSAPDLPDLSPRN